MLAADTGWDVPKKSKKPFQLIWASGAWFEAIVLMFVTISVPHATARAIPGRPIWTQAQALAHLGPATIGLVQHPFVPAHVGPGPRAPAGGHGPIWAWGMGPKSLEGIEVP